MRFASFLSATSVPLCTNPHPARGSCPTSRSSSPLFTTRAMLVIPGGTSDAERCAALYYSAVRDGAAPKYTPAQREAWAPSREAAPWLIERLTAGKTWLVVGDNELLGFLCAALHESDTSAINVDLLCGLSDSDAAYLDLFYIAPEKRRGSVAPALYAAYDAWAGDRVRTAHASHMLKPFLLRRGWTTVAEENVVRRGETLGCWSMRKSTA